MKKLRTGGVFSVLSFCPKEMLVGIRGHFFAGVVLDTDEAVVHKGGKKAVNILCGALHLHGYGAVYIVSHPAAEIMVVGEYLRGITEAHALYAACKFKCIS